ncbi:MAG: hypothetical protein JXI43_05700 [Tissierellales bacterium]|nr:hypothetical protein [Tissierellales bacterium]
MMKSILNIICVTSVVILISWYTNFFVPVTYAKVGYINLERLVIESHIGKAAKRIIDKNEKTDDKEELEKKLKSIILKKADVIFKKIAKENNYSIVIKDPDIVGYLSPEVDITDIIIKEMNKLPIEEYSFDNLLLDKETAKRKRQVSPSQDPIKSTRKSESIISPQSQHSYLSNKKNSFIATSNLSRKPEKNLLKLIGVPANDSHYEYEKILEIPKPDRSEAGCRVTGLDIVGKNLFILASYEYKKEDKNIYEYQLIEFDLYARKILQKKETITDWPLASGMEVIDDEIYFAFYNSEDILVYDLNSFKEKKRINPLKGKSYKSNVIKFHDGRTVKFKDYYQSSTVMYRDLEKTPDGLFILACPIKEDNYILSQLDWKGDIKIYELPSPGRRAGYDNLAYNDGIFLLQRWSYVEPRIYRMYDPQKNLIIGEYPEDKRSKSKYFVEVREIEWDGTNFIVAISNGVYLRWLKKVH